MSVATEPAPATAPALSLTRLHLMRGGYLLMGVGLALVKWPLLSDARALPLHEGLVLCLLTAMSLLAFLGLRYPVKLIPVLLFESAWKVLWLGLVALPTAATGDLLWARKLDDHQFARVTGAPTLFEGKLYVPLASFEVSEFASEFRRLRERGVAFTREPTRSGPVLTAVFSDTCGNLIQLYQQA